MSAQDNEQLAAQAIEAGDYGEAFRLLKPLADANSPYALLTLGWLCETGARGAPDKDAARSYYKRAAAEGSGSAYFYLGALLLGDDEEAQAQAAFERGATLDDDDCKAALARLAIKATERLAAQSIEAGEYEEAERLLQPLAEGGSEYALLSLAWLRETGASGATDTEGARQYYERAAAQGSASAYFELGRFLLSQGDELRARPAFEAGARLGDVPSMSNLGRMMVEGRGGHEDIAAGSAWLEQAASQGHIFAQRTLLGMEGREARTVFGKLSAKIKIASLATRGAKELLKDPQSDKLR